MPKGSPKPVQKAVEPTINIPEGVSEFYTNSLNVLLTPWDFVLLFGSIELPTSIKGLKMQSSSGTVRVDAAMRMSPQHAKAASRVLQNMVKAYEEAFGEISIPIEDKVS